MGNPDIARILERLSSQPHEAWSEFLEAFAPLIHQVIRCHDRNVDDSADCFLFVCQQLAQKRFRRLRRFREGGPASFPTWLRAVVRHLCLDWRRKRFGRFRVFRSVSRLPSLEQDVFRCVYARGMSLDETYLTLHPRYPTLSAQQLEDSLETVRQALTPHQRGLVESKRRLVVPIQNDPIDLDHQVHPIADPEAVACSEEQRRNLKRALSRLSGSDRLILRLRYEQDLTLEKVAGLMELGNAQSADRRIRKVLAFLRSELIEPGKSEEKPTASPCRLSRESEYE
jgi:RNA polymerase sigma factor (sigma-70 family)